MLSTRAPETLRTLDPEPLRSLEAYTRAGGGAGLEAARKLGPAGTIGDIEASGLRGRGGAGFPTGTKWRTVATYESATEAATVVVNGAEGEPGSFKDRAILRRNPFKVIEGALIAALAVAADRIVIALKEGFREEARLLRAAMSEIEEAAWSEGVRIELVEGPSEYLFGEETALLEVIAGRPPFPRIAPPFRHGAEEVGDGAASPADVTMASTGEQTLAPPTLVNNVETLANVPSILANGPDWFRELGTPESPGTIVCTVSGATTVDAVGEVPMGTTLRTVIDVIGGGALKGGVLAVMSGVANPLIPASLLDTPLSHEAMTEIGSGIGATGFIVFGEGTDLVAVGHGVSRFLAVESCGQCTPCKQDGLAISGLLEKVRMSEADEHDLDEVRDRLRTVADEARCYLATQHQLVVSSILELFPETFAAHIDGGRDAVEPYLIAPIVDIIDGRVVVDDSQATKQPDWAHDDTWSGKAPADEIDESAAG
jgi:NADH:ubiquinone oxidoreductase subunit F (NADH-binding)